MPKTRSLRPLVYLESLRRAALKVHASVHQDLFKNSCKSCDSHPSCISSKAGVVCPISLRESKGNIRLGWYWHGHRLAFRILR
jgi:hypothetical protein